VAESVASAEQTRLDDVAAGWKKWGPYVAERAWGTVREDYSPYGTSWDYFPHDHARSRAYRWNEDGLGGLCDDQQRLCLAFSFWNGVDPILKERIFGLNGLEGNHGEDAKEYWFYLDSTPTHSWMQWKYFYSQHEFPYDQLVQTNRQRTKLDPEFELLDTGIFDDDRYWEITADYAKADPGEFCIRLSIRNAGPDRAELHVLPTMWFRNTWSWRLPLAVPQIVVDQGALVADHRSVGRMSLRADQPPDEMLFCENETNQVRLFGADPSMSTPFPKDGINDHVVTGAPTVNPLMTGTKAAMHYRLTIAAGATEVITLRFGAGTGAGQADAGETGDVMHADTEHVLTLRRAEADEFYASLTPAGTTADEAAVLRQALGGMLWSKQFYHYDVSRWLQGDPGQPTPPPERLNGRNHTWRHVNNHEVISMPDTWEYPWYAAWDLAFHCVALAHVDPAFAKDQLLLMCREWYMHPNGQFPAYEWAFSDVNPPVHAWAAIEVFVIDGSRDFSFLERVLHKLLINFTWWVNCKDVDGNNVFEGGFLGLDNIGPIDRSATLPVSGKIEQSDGTAWMAMYCLDLLHITLLLAEHDPTFEDLATKFFEHFSYIATAINDPGLWDEEDGFYYDVLQITGEPDVPLKVRSMVGLLPLCAATILSDETLARLPQFAGRLEWFLKNRPEFARTVVHEGPVATAGGDEGGGLLLAIVSPQRLRRILERMLDEAEFLSPHGLRALSAAHRDQPFSVEVAGATFSVDYQPGESTSGLFGGNSNWRGPIWFPVNFLVISAVRRYAEFLGNDVTVEHPTGSGVQRTLGQISTDLSGRLIKLFLDDAAGRRPIYAGAEKFQTDPAWHRLISFFEYFHGDTGAGLGASHQTGWTGLVSNLIIRAQSGGIPAPVKHHFGP
jgi:hypothetical protein